MLQQPFEGATLCATLEDEAFPQQEGTTLSSGDRVGGGQAFIYACAVNDIALTGYGTIDGRGLLKNGNNRAKPHNLKFVSCRGVRIKGITTRNSPGGNQYFLDCEEMVIDNVKSWNHSSRHNDGIDFDGCRRVALTNSRFDADDDGIALKSTQPIPCRDITIKGCQISSFANAIKCGTESVGGFYRIHISDCVVRPSLFDGIRFVKGTPSGITAISLEITDGGTMEDVTVDNILIQGTECPLFIRLGNRARKYKSDALTPGVGTLRNVKISNISAFDTGNFSSSITGIEGHCVENVLVTNFMAINRGGIEQGDYRIPGDDAGLRHDTAGNIWGNKYWADASQVKEDDKGYPQPTVWGNLPCRGFFIRHARNIQLENVRFHSIGADPRTDIIRVDAE